MSPEELAADRPLATDIYREPTGNVTAVTGGRARAKAAVYLKVVDDVEEAKEGLSRMKKRQNAEHQEYKRRQCEYANANDIAARDQKPTFKDSLDEMVDSFEGRTEKAACVLAKL